jgi:hypothetical protein
MPLTTAVHQISIAVLDRTIEVVPDTLVMNANDEVHWKGATTRRFSIAFDGASPFEQPQLDQDAAETRRRPRTTGRFKYTVFAADDPGLKLDPVIVVDEPPSDANP